MEDPESNSDTAPADDDDDMGTTTEPIPDPSVGNTGINTSGQEGTSSDDGNQMDSTGNAFFVEPDGGGPVVECDVWDQDCPKGEKCMPWANDGGNSWNATRCSEIADNPGQVGDECTVEGSGVSGVDSCDESAMCYYVDPETGVGTCVGFCEGSPDNPMCEPGFLCAIANNGVLILCRRECDPLLQDCQGSAACLPAAGSDGFVCIVDASGETGAAGDPCEFINACDPGLTCTVAENVPGCMGAGCCTEFCDLTEVDPDAACTQAGQGCVSWFEKGNAPPMLDHVGFCALPM
ncbi:MAG: ribulose phosphate epimerase [Myxococcota bacterium]